MIDSAALVVQITLRISTSYSRKGTNSAQLLRKELDNRRIPLAPLVGELLEPILRCRLARSRVDGLERFHDRIPVLPARIAEATTDEMDYALVHDVCSQVVLIASVRSLSL